MRRSLLAAVLAIAACLLATPATAMAADPPEVTFQPASVKLIKHGDAARVKLTITCDAGLSYEFNISVQQNRATESALYTSNDIANHDDEYAVTGTCTGSPQKHNVKVDRCTGCLPEYTGRLLAGEDAFVAVSDGWLDWHYLPDLTSGAMIEVS